MLCITRLHRLARLSSVSALILSSSLAFAQAPAPRIRSPIELTPSVPLEGSLNPHVRLSDDLGPLAPDTPIRGITLVFKRSAAQEADLQQILSQQANPSSPLYHHWLTPEDFADRFGIADADIAATESWLQSHGFTIDDVSRNHDRITFSGTAAQIQQAFGAELHHFRSGSDTEPELHFAPAAELSLPATLAPLTAAVLHLSDFRPKPNIRAIHPDYTTAGSQSHFLAPKDIASMYDLFPLTVGMNDTGTGQSLAIVGQTFVKTGVGTIISTFTGIIAAANPSITPVIVPGSGNEAISPGDLGESEIDLEYSSSLVPSANIFFVYTGSSSNYSVFDALDYAITEDIAPVISISYGGCEPLMNPTYMQQANAVFEEAAAQGQTIVASSGDTGAAACAPYSSSSGVSTAQQQQLAADFPASSPYVTGVGGTQMAPGTFAPGTSNYWAAAVPGVDNTASLLTYVPEVAWNEDSSTFGLGASGGGTSTIFTRPSWQSGVPGIPSGGYRLVPDIALEASVKSPGYVLCSDDPYIVGSLTDCTSGLEASNGSYVVTGGTSFGAPIFAAFVVSLNQNKQALGLGNINPVLYSLAAQPTLYASLFHDITTGTTACAIGDGNCGTPGTSGYAATTGYDMATGLGSLDFAKVASNWPSTPPSNSIVPTYMYLSNTPQTATAGAPAAVAVNLTISNALCGLCTPPSPSGNLAVLVDGALVTPPSLQPANLGATATFNFVAPSTTGSHVVVVRYPGDAYHLPSSSTFAVLVGNVIPSGSFTLAANNLTLASNGSGSTQVTITPSAGYSGALTWSSSVTGGTVAQALCYIVQSGSVNGPTTATMSMGTGTSCSSSPTGSRAPSRLQGPAQRSAVEPSSNPSSCRTPAAAAFLALLLFGILPSRRRRKLLPILSTLTLAILATTLTGCGGGSSTNAGGGGGSGTGPQPQVYTITLKGTDSVNTAITASTTFTLTVNN